MNSEIKTSFGNVPVTDSTLEIGDSALDLRVWGAGNPQIVMLHDGLGSVDQWQLVPIEVALRTGCTIAAYNRSGHGNSTPAPTGPWPTDWLHSEADVLQQVLTRLECDRPMVIGHSDGGSIALIHESIYRDSSAVLTIAAHSWVESVCFDAIVAMRSKRDRMVKGLGRYHSHPQELFEAWSGVWTSPEFRSWDIRSSIARIETPVWVAQGTEDEYATPSHVQLTADAIGSNAQPILLDGGRHLMHYRDPEMVIDLITRFVAADSSI